MKPELSELLEKWDRLKLTRTDAAELRLQLQDPAARRELVADWFLHEALCEHHHPGAFSPARLARVRRRHARTIRRRTLAVLAGLATAALVTWLLVPHFADGEASPPSAAAAVGRAASFRGEASLIAAENPAPQPLGVMPTALRAGDRVVTAEAASADLMLDDGSTIELKASSDVRLSPGRTTDLELTAGAADFTFVSPHTVTTPKMRAETNGGQLRLIVDASSSWVAVNEGLVRVTRRSDSKSYNLGPGHYAAVHADWPFLKMNALVCPVWQQLSLERGGSIYPKPRS